MGFKIALHGLPSKMQWIWLHSPAVLGSPSASEDMRAYLAIGMS
jgi:hypothetical protein